MSRPRFSDILRDGAVLPGAALLGLAGGGAALVLALKHLPLCTPWFVLGGLLVAGAAVVLGRWALKPSGSRRHRRFVFCVLLGSLVLRIVFLGLSAPGYPQTADRLFFRDFIDHWAAGGWRGEGLDPLSSMHDYRLWASRGWPQHLGFRLIAPGHHVYLAQLFNAGLGVLILGTIYALARRGLSRRRARFALVLAALSPVHLWMALDYTYQFQGAALFALVFGLLVLFLQRERALRLWRGLFLGLVLCGLHLQQGLNWLAMAMAGIPPLIWMAQGRGKTSLRFGWVVLAPAVLLSVAATRPFDRWIAAHDRRHVYSHAIAQMGIGFNPETGGEFYGPYVEIDRGTPAEAKTETAFRLVFSQIRYNPSDALVRLPIVKMVKYLQLGAATGVEEALQAAGRNRSRDLFRGARVLYAPALLFLAALGLLRMRRGNKSAATFMACTLLGFGLIYGFITQTSPRYSFYLFPLLATLAANLPSWRGWRMASWRKSMPHPLWLLPVLALWGTWGGLARGLTARLPETFFFRDARTLSIRGEGWSRGITSRTLAPFLATARAQSARRGEAVFDLGHLTGPGRLSFFLWGGNMDGLRIRLDGEWLDKQSIVATARRIEVGLPRSGDLSLWLTPSARNVPGGDQITVGYIGVQPSATPARR